MTTQSSKWFVMPHYYHGLCTVEHKPASGVRSCSVCVIPVRPDPVTERLRPISNINTLWTVYDYANIDEILNYPEVDSDANYCQLEGVGSVAQRWGIETPVMTQGKIKTAKAWILIHANANNSVTISGVKIRLGDTWRDFGDPNRVVTTIPSWLGCEITGWKVSPSGSDPAIEVTMDGNNADGIGYVDAAYLEVSIEY